MKIISTMGPSIMKNGAIKQAIKRGCSGFRFNSAHSDKLVASEQIKYIRSNYGDEVNIIYDLQGQKIRVSGIIDSEIHLNDNERVIFCSEEYYKVNKNIEKGLIPIDIEFDFNIIVEQDYFSVKNDRVVFIKEWVKDDCVCCKVKGKGILRAKNGINIKSLSRANLILTERDKQDIVYAINNDVDTIYISYVVNATNVKSVKNYINKYLKKNGMNLRRPKIYSKIENYEGIENFEEILKVSDGIVLGRGDLAVEINSIEYPVLQEKIINRMKRSKKPLVIATHILESLAYRSKPSISETSDLYHFIKNKVDGIVLVTETSVGRNPGYVVGFANKFITEYCSEN